MSDFFFWGGGPSFQNTPDLIPLEIPGVVNEYRRYNQITEARKLRISKMMFHDSNGRFSGAKC